MHQIAKVDLVSGAVLNFFSYPFLKRHWRFLSHNKRAPNMRSSLKRETFIIIVQRVRNRQWQGFILDFNTLLAVLRLKVLETCHPIFPAFTKKTAKGLPKIISDFLTWKVTDLYCGQDFQSLSFLSLADSYPIAHWKVWIAPKDGLQHDESFLVDSHALLLQSDNLYLSEPKYWDFDSGPSQTFAYHKMQESSAKNLLLSVEFKFWLFEEKDWLNFKSV